MSEVSKGEYVDFMCNPENIMNCSSCPENNDFSSLPGNRLLCDQFHCCLVELYCKSEEDEDE